MSDQNKVKSNSKSDLTSYSKSQIYINS